MMGSMLPMREPVFWTISLEMPDQIGAARLVPPTTESLGLSDPHPDPEMQLPSSKKNPPGWLGLAIIAMSGTVRIVPEGPPDTF